MAEEEESNSASSATSPKGSMHYEWNSKTADRKKELESLGVDSAPKPVSATGSSAAATASTGSGSAWNTGGTWEERNVTKKAVPLLKEAVQSIRDAAIEGESAYTATIHSVSSCEGSVTLVINRGKVRPGFELEVKCEWSLAASSPSTSGATETTNSSSSSSSSSSLASGTISIPELSDSDGAAIFSSFQCTCTEAQAPLDKAKAKALASEVVKKTLREKLREWVESVKSL